jgi:predicted nucleic acid-binding protein
MGQLETWFDELVRDHCEWLPVSDAVARRSATLRARLRLSGKSRRLPEMLIAATARVHNLVLVTRDIRDFTECGIRVVDPFAS